MPNRIIKESICTSASIDGLAWFDEVFFYRLIVNCDDYGRFDARPAVLRSRLFPLKEVTVKQVESALSKLVAAGMVRVYECKNQPYLQLESWGKHQSVRNKRSKYPEPPALESNCNQLHANVPVIQSVSLSESESESESNPSFVAVADAPVPDRPPVPKVPSVQDRRFSEFWTFYPKRIGKGAAEKSYAKIKPDDALHKQILAAIVAAKKSDQWTRDGGQFIPNPATWLNQRRWEDEPPTERSGTNATDLRGAGGRSGGTPGADPGGTGSARQGDGYRFDADEIARVASIYRPPTDTT